MKFIRRYSKIHNDEGGLGINDNMRRDHSNTSSSTHFRDTSANGHTTSQSPIENSPISKITPSLHNNTNSSTEGYSNKHKNFPTEDSPTVNSPSEAQSTSTSTRRGASSNYLSLKSRATPRDRGEGSDGSSIMGMMEDGSKDVLDVTSSGMKSSSGPQVEPVADLREAKGEVNKKATMASGMECRVSTGPRVEPVADLREAEGQLNRGAVCKTTSGGKTSNTGAVYKTTKGEGTTPTGKTQPTDTDVRTYGITPNMRDKSFNDYRSSDISSDDDLRLRNRRKNIKLTGVRKISKFDDNLSPSNRNNNNNFISPNRSGFTNSSSSPTTTTTGGASSNDVRRVDKDIRRVVRKKTLDNSHHNRSIDDEDEDDRRLRSVDIRGDLYNKKVINRRDDKLIQEKRDELLKRRIAQVQREIEKKPELKRQQSSDSIKTQLTDNPSPTIQSYPIVNVTPTNWLSKVSSQQVLLTPSYNDTLIYGNNMVYCPNVSNNIIKTNPSSTYPQIKARQSSALQILNPETGEVVNSDVKKVKPMEIPKPPIQDVIYPTNTPLYPHVYQVLYPQNSVGNFVHSSSTTGGTYAPAITTPSTYPASTTIPATTATPSATSTTPTTYPVSSTNLAPSSTYPLSSTTIPLPTTTTSTYPLSSTTLAPPITATTTLAPSSTFPLSSSEVLDEDDEKLKTVLVSPQHMVKATQMLSQQRAVMNLHYQLVHLQQRLQNEQKVYKSKGKNRIRNRPMVQNEVLLTLTEMHPYFDKMDSSKPILQSMNKSKLRKIPNVSLEDSKSYDESDAKDDHSGQLTTMKQNLLSINTNIDTSKIAVEDITNLKPIQDSFNVTTNRLINKGDAKTEVTERSDPKSVVKKEVGPTKEDTPNKARSDDRSEARSDDRIELQGEAKGEVRIETNSDARIETSSEVRGDVKSDVRREDKREEVKSEDNESQISAPQVPPTSGDRLQPPPSLPPSQKSTDDNRIPTSSDSSKHQTSSFLEEPEMLRGGYDIVHVPRVVQIKSDILNGIMDIDYLLRVGFTMDIIPPDELGMFKLTPLNYVIGQVQKDNKSSSRSQRSRTFIKNKNDKWRNEPTQNNEDINRLRKPKLTKEEQFTRTVRTLLNKLTVEKFLTVGEKIAVIYENLDNLDNVEIMVNLLHEKAISELEYSDMYADLAFLLKYRFNDPLDIGFKTTYFHRTLLNKCQDSFESINNNTINKDLILGNIRFMGELFLRKVISITILKRISQSLLNLDIDTYKEPSEHLVECFTELLTTIGYTVEQIPGGKEMLDEYMKILSTLRKSKNYTTRISFKIQDLIDLRDKNWKKKLFKEKATSVAQVHIEAQQEELKGGSIHILQEGKYTTAGLQTNRHYTDYLLKRRQIALDKLVNGIYIGGIINDDIKNNDNNNTSSPSPPQPHTTTSIQQNNIDDIIDLYLQNPTHEQFINEWNKYQPNEHQVCNIFTLMCQKATYSKTIQNAYSLIEITALLLTKIPQTIQYTNKILETLETNFLMRLQDEILDNPNAVLIFGKLLEVLFCDLGIDRRLLLENMRLPNEFEISRDLVICIVKGVRNRGGEIGFVRRVLRRSLYSKFDHNDCIFLDEI